MPTRAQVLAYRAAVQHLEHPTGDGVLPAGVQDMPPGSTADRALHARGTHPADLLLVPELVLAQTVRAAPHLHRKADLPLFTAAIGALQITDLAKEHFGPFDQKADLPGAVAHVALAMRQVFADSQPRTKSELSTALTDLVDPRLAPWCRRCSAHHVQDALFRYATLQANLVLQHTPHRYTPLPTAAAPPPDPAASLSTLARRFLHLCGPARPEHLARWLALRPATARRVWKTLTPDLVPVDIDGYPAFMHEADLTTLETTPPVLGVHLLPPHDPLLEFASRALLLPDRAQRTAIYRPVASPSVLLVRGEILGTWHRHTTPRQLTITITPFTPLPPPDRRAITTHATHLFQPQSPHRQIRTKFTP